MLLQCNAVTIYRIRGVNYLHEEMNSISNMLSFKSSMNVICTCFVVEICMNKILFKPSRDPFLDRYV